ncbi:hypothetical protein [Caballeronia sp. Sq4a]|uniref:hypothetical protein n=1 Tax=Caballeronia sp. Sq4a TaxID=2878152 RepID=UPI0020BF46C7|nr:hypothetical protein [Caballeronia sp. Sq4a]
MFGQNVVLLRINLNLSFEELRSDEEILFDSTLFTFLDTSGKLSYRKKEVSPRERADLERAIRSSKGSAVKNPNGRIRPFIRFQVLVMIHFGASARSLAKQFNISETTVRTLGKKLRMTVGKNCDRVPIDVFRVLSR